MTHFHTKLEQCDSRFAAYRAGDSKQLLKGSGFFDDAVGNVKIRSYAASVLALVCLTAPSLGADLPVKKGPPVAPPPVFTWTGFYIGVNFGHAWTGSDPIAVASANVFDVTAGGFGPASALGASGVVRARLDDCYFGGQAGYNWQFTEKFVGGLEADIQGAGVRGGGGLANVTTAPSGFAVTSATLRRSLEHFGTVRGRLGYAVTPTILVYATGGLAYGGVNITSAMAQSLTPSLLIADVAKGDLYENRVGWTIGGGGEMALGYNLSAKLEYLYYDLGSASVANPLGFTDVTTGALQLIDAMRVSTRFNGQLLRLGLNYRFDWGIPRLLTRQRRRYSPRRNSRRRNGQRSPIGAYWRCPTCGRSIRTVH